MSDTSIKISYSLDSDDSVMFSMEQKEIPVYIQTANYSDIVNMFMRANSGLTAFSYNRFNSMVAINKSNIIISLDFYVWVLPLDTVYSVSIPEGEISEGSLEELEKEKNVIVSLSDEYSFPYLIEVESLDWETPCYNSLGERLVQEPSWEVDDYKIKFSEKVFGVARVKYKAKGYLHTVKVKFPKTNEGLSDIKQIIDNQTNFNSISDVNVTVVGTYVDSSGESKDELLTLELPEAITLSLEECPDFGAGSSVKVNNCKDAGKKGMTFIYYSTCTGEILDIHRVEIECGV